MIWKRRKALIDLRQWNIKHIQKRMPMLSHGAKHRKVSCSVALRAMEGSSKAWELEKMDQMEVRKGDHQYASPILQSQATTLSHNRMRYLIHSVVKLSQRSSILKETKLTKEWKTDA